MPTVFPEILFLSFFAPILLRIGVAVIFLDETRHLMRNKNSSWRAIVPAVLGLSLASGFLTQPAALASIVYALAVGKFMKTDSVFANPLLLLLSILVFGSLFITGSGAFAIDLPY